MNKKIFLWAIIFTLIFSASICRPNVEPEKIWVTTCNSFPDLPPSEARLANEYCPSHPAQYLKSNQPTIICTLHVKPGPPIPVCDKPWPDFHVMIAWDGALLSFFCEKRNDEATAEDEVAYANALAEDGITITRGFSHFYDDIPGYWESWKPVDLEYRPILQERLKLMADRKITSIISLEPYGAGLAPDADIDWIIDSCEPFLPYVIFETANESGDMGLHTKLINQLKGHGIPSENIMLYFVDSGEFADMLINGLEGKGLAGLHGVGSMDTINAPWPRGWATSDGTLKLMEYGLTGSNDGEDGEHAAKGLFWPWMPNGPGRRSTAAQGHEITEWMLAHGRGWEFLSAGGFVKSNRPNLKDAIENGREERRAMRAAYDEIK